MQQSGSQGRPRRYYIRAKGDNKVYWYCTPNGDIIASRTNSTRFRIVNVDDKLKGAVMIGSDSVNLLLGQYAVGIASQGNLQQQGKADSFMFSNFANGFTVNGAGGYTLPGVVDKAIIQANDEDGEPWELVLNGTI